MSCRPVDHPPRAERLVERDPDAVEDFGIVGAATDEAVIAQRHDDPILVLLDTELWADGR